VKRLLGFFVGFFFCTAHILLFVCLLTEIFNDIESYFSFSQDLAHGKYHLRPKGSLTNLPSEDELLPEYGSPSINRTSKVAKIKRRKVMFS
jgi:hypothetical protein